MFVLLFKIVAAKNTETSIPFFSWLAATTVHSITFPLHSRMFSRVAEKEANRAGSTKLLCWGTAADPHSLHCDSSGNCGAQLQLLPSAAYSLWAPLITASQLFSPFYTPLITLLLHQAGSSAGVNPEKFYSKGSFYCSGNYRKRNLVFYVAHSFINAIHF